MGLVTDSEPIFVNVSLWDDSITTLRMFEPRRRNNKVHNPLVLVWPGYGMGARYYDPCAQELASRGFYVATSELHGQGTNTAIATREHNFGYHHMASSDFPRSIEAAKKSFGLDHDHPTYLLGHSRGGQVATLFLARPEATELAIQGLMTVGSGSPYWKGFQGRERIRMRYGTRILEAIVKIFGYQPEGIWDVAGYGRQSGAFVTEWLRCLRTNQLNDLLEQDMDYELARTKIAIPMLFTRCVDDNECPIASAANLAASLPANYVRIEEIPENLGHNRWARQPAGTVSRFERFVVETS